MPDPDKRKMRELKRAIKKRGNKRRRQELKRGLAENPEGAAEAEENLGKHRSDSLNRLDNDSTRRHGPNAGSKDR
jgi:hypothetical protein